MTTQYAADMHTEAIAQAQVGKTMPCPCRVLGHVNIGYVYIAVEQMAFIQRLLESEHLLLYIARTKVLHKQTFHKYALLLESSRQNHDKHYRHSYCEQKGIGESCEIIADVEHKSRGYDQTYKDGNKQRHTIAATLAPQRTKLLRVILLHHYGTQEGGYNHDGEHTAYSVCPPVHAWHKMAHEWQEEHEHQSDGCNGQYGVDERDACHLRYKAVPVALGSCRRMRERYVVERTYPRLGQSALEHSVAGHREAYHIRC